MARGFRVWDKQTKSYEWDREFVLGSSGELMELYSRHNGTWEYHFADTDRFIVEFDTGIKDKNGKEIYEGDIVRCWDDESGEVYFCDTSLQYRVRFTDGDDEDLASCEAEIISNIHETPKGGKK